MHTPPIFAWLKDNTMIVQLGTTDEPLTDELTGTVITDATVQVIDIRDLAGTVVTGETFPKAMNHVAGGVYRAGIAHALVVSVGVEYQVEIRAEKSGSRGTWRLKVLVTERDE
jgi:hypothetical protein